MKFKIELRKEIIFLTSLFFIVAVVFIAVSIYQWAELANEEYFYENPKKLKKKLEEFPNDLNIVNMKKIKASVDPSRFKFVIMADAEGNNKILGMVAKEALSHNPDFIIFLETL